MIQKKICMVGAFGVGKTSLVERFVKSIFSDAYMTTVGVKIEKKQLTIGNEEITLMLWDLAGKDAVTHIRPDQLKGSAGYIVVLDGTRRETLKTAFDLHALSSEATANAPFTFVVNKSDLRADWEITDSDLEQIGARDLPVVVSSAKSGDGVEALFVDLATRILRKDHGGEQSAAAPAR
jgi:small GTP-binding protein